jgi:hypothetical protein
MSRVFSSSSASGERLADEFIQLGIHRGDFRSAEFIPLHFADKRGVLELGRALVFTQALKRTEAFQFPVGKRKKESNWASLGCANELKNSDCKWLITKEPPNRYLEVRAPFRFRLRRAGLLWRKVFHFRDDFTRREHRTSNIQRRTSNVGKAAVLALGVGCWESDVGCFRLRLRRAGEYPGELRKFSCLAEVHHAYCRHITFQRH